MCKPILPRARRRTDRPPRRAPRLAAMLILALAPAGCGSEPEREPVRLTDRAPVTPSPAIEGLARRVAARNLGAVGAQIPGGLRIDSVGSDDRGVLFVLTTPPRNGDAARPAPSEAMLLAARASLADRSCPLSTPLEQDLLREGGELRFRYLSEDGAPSHELALRLADCEPIWLAAAKPSLSPEGPPVDGEAAGGAPAAAPAETKP